MSISPSTVSLGGSVASSSMPFSYSPASGSIDPGPSQPRPRFDRAPPVPLPTSESYARYAYYEIPSTSNTHPLLASAWKQPDKFRHCLARAQDVRQENESSIGLVPPATYGTFNMPDGSLYSGITRRGALFCRTGVWMEMLPEWDESLQGMGRMKKRTSMVRGTKDEQSKFSVLEFIAVTFGLISIRGVESDTYLCMNEGGELYAADSSNYSSECIFVEEMLENYFNLYSSCVYGHLRKPWYVAIRRSGKTRMAKLTRKRRKAAHFLVVHHDLSPELRLFKPKVRTEGEDLPGEEQNDVTGLVENTLHHNPYGADINGERKIRVLTIKLQANFQKFEVEKGKRKGKGKGRQRTRAERLKADQAKREQRKKQLDELRIRGDAELRRMQNDHHERVIKMHALREAQRQEALRKHEQEMKKLPYSYAKGPPGTLTTPSTTTVAQNRVVQVVVRTTPRPQPPFPFDETSPLQPHHVETLTLQNGQQRSHIFKLPHISGRRSTADVTPSPYKYQHRHSGTNQ